MFTFCLNSFVFTLLEVRPTDSTKSIKELHTIE